MTSPSPAGGKAAYFDHVARPVGVGHVGLGSDSALNGYDRLPPEVMAKMRAGYTGGYGLGTEVDTAGPDHPERVYDLAEGLTGRKYSDRNIELILGGNFKRALSHIWLV